MFHNMKKLNDYRVTRGPWATKPNEPFGLFFIPVKIGKPPIKVIASPFDCEEGEWQHVSASHANRTPTWDEMCKLKDLFWSPQDTVLQFHPPESEYVNNHPHCLHLWKQVGAEVPLPPSTAVGYKELGVIT